jgi:putative spermidine/putrescine transport system substrate-binding protein
LAPILLSIEGRPKSERQFKRKGGKTMSNSKKIISVAMMTFICLAMAWVGPSKNAFGEEKLVICSWGGAYKKALRDGLYNSFEKKTGIRIIGTSWPDPAKIRAMVDTGNVEWDLVDISGGYATILKKHNALEKIDYSRFDKKLFDEVFEGTFKPYTVRHSFYSQIMAYRKDVFGTQHPKNWKEFWDVKRFPGPRSLMSGSGMSGGLEFALIADGVPIDKLYPLDVERAYKKLTEIKPYVVKWWKSGSNPPQLLTDKEVVAASSYHGRIIKIKEDGEPVDIVWNQGKLNNEYWGIPRGTKNYENALKFIEFSLQAQNQANWVHAYLGGIGPTNKKAFPLIKPEILKNTPTSPENRKVQFLNNDEWWGKNLERTTELWNTWVIQK